MQTAVLQYHSGYTLCELGPLVRRLYAMLARPTDENLRAVKNKYSHKYVPPHTHAVQTRDSEPSLSIWFIISSIGRVFFEVGETALVSTEMLEEALSEPDLTLS